MEVRGTAIAPMPKFILRRFGQDGLDKWRQALTAEARRLIDSAIDPGRWYPFREALLEPTEAAGRLFYEEALIGAREMGADSAEYALSGFYRSVVKLNTIRLYVERGGVMITEYYRPCRSRTASVGKGRAVVLIDEFPESHPLVENRIAGWMQRAMEVRGCRRVGVEIARSLAGGDALTEFVITWDEG